jgi:hypothetical protein
MRDRWQTGFAAVGLTEARAQSRGPGSIDTLRAPTARLPHHHDVTAADGGAYFG